MSDDPRCTFCGDPCECGYAAAAELYEPAKPAPIASDAAGGLPFTAKEAEAELRRRYPRAFDGTDPLNDSSGLLVENAKDWVLAAILALSAPPVHAGEGEPRFTGLMASLAEEIAAAAEQSDATPLERFVAEALTSDDAKVKGLVDRVWVVSLPDARKAIAAIRTWDRDHPASGEDVETDDRLKWFLHLIERAGGKADAGDNPHSLLQAFSDDRGAGDDTYNVSESAGYSRTTHSGWGDGSATVEITDAGRAILAAMSNRRKS